MSDEEYVADEEFEFGVDDDEDEYTYVLTEEGRESVLDIDKMYRAGLSVEEIAEVLGFEYPEDVQVLYAIGNYCGVLDEESDV